MEKQNQIILTILFSLFFSTESFAEKKELTCNIASQKPELDQIYWNRTHPLILITEDQTRKTIVRSDYVWGSDKKLSECEVNESYIPAFGQNPDQYSIYIRCSKNHHLGLKILDGASRKGLLVLSLTDKKGRIIRNIKYLAACK